MSSSGGRGDLSPSPTSAHADVGRPFQWADAITPKVGPLGSLSYAPDEDVPFPRDHDGDDNNDNDVDDDEEGIGNDEFTRVRTGGRARSRHTEGYGEVVAAVPEEWYCGLVVGLPASVPAALFERGLPPARWLHTVQALNESSFHCRGSLPMALLCAAVLGVLALLAVAFYGKHSHGFRDLRWHPDDIGSAFFAGVLIVLAVLGSLSLALYLATRAAVVRSFLHVENTLYYHPRGLELSLPVDRPQGCRVLVVRSISP